MSERERIASYPGGAVPPDVAKVINRASGARAMLAAAPLPPAETPERKTMITDAQIHHMVGRFLAWRLPEDFNPDGGISFKRTFNENTPHPMKHEPSGTNLFDATQTEAMVRHMVAEMSPAETPDVHSPAIAARRERQASESEGMETSALIERLRENAKEPQFSGDLMKRWDSWREYIAGGGTASWPRDAFESVVAWFAEDCAEAADALARLEADNERLRAGYDSALARWQGAEAGRQEAESKLTAAEAALATTAAELTAVLKQRDTAQKTLAALREKVGKVLEPLANGKRGPEQFIAVSALLADIKKETDDG